MNQMVLVGFALLLLAAFSQPAHAQNVTCNQVGSQVFCSNGQTFFRSGGVTLDNQGHVWNSIGNQTIGSQGDLYTRNKNQVFDNKGNAWDIIGGQQVGPSGNKCAPVGDQVFCRK